MSKSEILVSDDPCADHILNGFPVTGTQCVISKTGDNRHALFETHYLLFQAGNHLVRGKT